MGTEERALRRGGGAWAIVCAAVLGVCGQAASAESIGFRYAMDPEDGENDDEPVIEDLQDDWTDAFRGWTGRVELGLNGSSGNTEAFNFRGGVSGMRTSDRFETSLRATYSFARRDGDVTQNRARLGARNDWLLPDDSPWRFFVTGDLELDEFQDWDARLSAFAGVGYEFVETDRTFLLGRVGLGGNREFGGTDTDINPEGLIGLDFRHDITDRQRVSATVDFFPDLDDFGDYRLNARGEYEILIDEENNLSLSLGAETRYDSTPGPGFRRNDFDYYALLVWTF